MVNLGKEIENDKKWNEKKLGPCMNVFLNFDPYTTLDHLRKINEKKRQKLRRHTSHSLMQLAAKSLLLSQSFAHKINDKIH